MEDATPERQREGVTMQSLFVPVDGSDTSWRAVDAAIALARRNDVQIHVYEMVQSPDDVDEALNRMNDTLSRRDSSGLSIDLRAEAFDGTPAAAISHFVDQHPAATVVMASHGRGRSAALMGSVTEDILQRTFGPVMVVGPHADAPRFTGPVLVPVDGGNVSEAAIPLGVAWATELGVSCWLVHVSEPSTGRPGDVVDTAYVARLARQIQRTTGHHVDFDELHGTDPVRAVADFADGLGAGLIVATTHGRTGWSRLTSGSISSGFVRDASCPVLEQRLPRPGSLAGADALARHATNS
jgi:nucleotide-binding universal stress UspA family protein